MSSSKPKPKAKKVAPLFHEKQSRQDCAVHAFNNMLQKPVLTPMILTKHVLDTTRRVNQKNLMSCGTPTEPGTNFSTCALSTWIRHATPGQLPAKSALLAAKTVRVPDNTDGLVRIIRETMLQHHAVFTDGFMVMTKSVNNGFPHAISVIKRSNRWQIVDSEFKHLQPFTNIRDYLAKQVNKTTLNISFLRGKLTAKEMAKEDAIIDLWSDSDDEGNFSGGGGGRGRKRTMSKQDLLFRMAKLGVYGSVDDLGTMTKQQLVDLSRLA